jgi:hypothetical protein
MLTMIYITRIQNMSVFLLKVNNPSVRHLVWPRLALVGHPSLPFPLALRLAPSSPLFGRSQGYKFAQICITLCPSCIASLKTLASLLWIHCVRPIVQGGFTFPILDYHDQFNASI